MLYQQPLLLGRALYLGLNHFLRLLFLGPYHQTATPDVPLRYSPYCNFRAKNSPPRNIDPTARPRPTKTMTPYSNSALRVSLSAAWVCTMPTATYRTST